MHRARFSCALLSLIALPCRAGDPDPNPETLIRLNVQPAAAPTPALRYLLLPELREMSPGNPIQNYLKCFMDQQKFFFDKEEFERRQQLLAMPLGALPAQELQNYGGLALDQADWAARLDNPDWQILAKMKADGVRVLLPDVQQIRTLGRALKVRLRAQVALKKFDEAIRTAKTMFALARQLGDHPIFIANVVGVSIASSAIDPLEEMLAQPGCPNLFWALTSLPSPFISLDKSRQGERLMVLAEFRDLDDSAPMTPQQIQRFIAHIDPLKPGIRGWLDGRIHDDGLVTAARHRLADSGIPRDRLLHFPAEQVLLLDEKHELETRLDDTLKLINLPAWQVEELAAQDTAPRPRSLFADALVPPPYNMTRAQGRLDQQFALLRHVEALRMHAAAHKGALPATLADIALPLPPDPFSGKAFHYERDGATAHLRGTPPRGFEKTAPFNMHFEVTIRQ
jgi:hypothetical protein